jgi:hypothetical protein
MPAAMGTTHGWKRSVPTLKPSTADTTDMAGVITVSP